MSSTGTIAMKQTMILRYLERYLGLFG